MNSTKELILEAARGVLIREGSSGFSMRKVAEEASISLSNVQYHYKTRDDLYHGLLGVYTSHLKGILSTYFDHSSSGEENLRRFIQGILLEEAQEDEIRLALAITAFAEKTVTNNHLNDFYGEFYSLISDFLAQIAEKPTDSADITRGASLLVTFINGYGIVSNQLGLEADDMVQELTKIIWGAINDSD